MILTFLIFGFYSTYIGLKYDDLRSEESPLVKEALRRLEIAEPREAYDRAYRIRVAMQCSLSHTLLPKEQWTTHESVRLMIIDTKKILTHNFFIFFYI
jgi:hypothetical protein